MGLEQLEHELKSRLDEEKKYKPGHFNITSKVEISLAILYVIVENLR